MATRPPLQPSFVYRVATDMRLGAITVPNTGYRHPRHTGHIVGHMATREKSARNDAAARYLSGLKATKRVTLPQLAEKTGINVETLKRQLRNRAVITLDDFAIIATSLGESEEDALVALSKVVAKKQP